MKKNTAHKIFNSISVGKPLIPVEGTPFNQWFNNNLHLSKPVATRLETRNFSAWFDDAPVLNDICVTFNKHQINCIVGPSGGGKSTLIRSINRINDAVEGFATQGEIRFNGVDIYAPAIDATQLRTEIGMVFQKPCVFPKSIVENVLFGLQHLKKLSSRQKHAIIEEKLKAAALWNEVEWRLNDQAATLSIGQQQRLCIARTLAVNPTVMLLDEPTSSLDPVSTRAIEELMMKLRDQYTIIFVTHDILQARRIADKLIFICEGKVIEQGDKEKLFTHPEKKQTWEYLNNAYCKC